MCLCRYLVEAKGAAFIDLLMELGEGCRSCSEPSLSNFLDSAGSVSKYLPGGRGKAKSFKEDHNLTLICETSCCRVFPSTLLQVKMSGVFSVWYSLCKILLMN